MYDFGTIRFVQQYKDQRIEHEIRGDASMDEVIDAFEHFLKGAGYHLKDGQHIGYEYDEEESEYQKRKEMYASMDPADNVVHSKYYWDTERNK